MTDQFTFEANPFAKSWFGLTTDKCTADTPAEAISGVFGEAAFKKHVIAHALTSDNVTAVTSVEAILNPDTMGVPSSVQKDYVGKVSRVPR